MVYILPSFFTLLTCVLFRFNSSAVFLLRVVLFISIFSVSNRVACHTCLRYGEIILNNSTEERRQTRESCVLILYQWDSFSVKSMFIFIAQTTLSFIYFPYQVMIKLTIYNPIVMTSDAEYTFVSVGDSRRPFLTHQRY